MPFPVASVPLRWKTIAFALLCGAILAGGFLPTAKSVSDALETLTNWHWWGTMAFPILAGLFCLSAPAPRSSEPAKMSLADALKTIPIPFAISMVFGLLRPGTSVFELLASPRGREVLLWFAVAVPVGEEWLFRGWVQTIAERFAPGVRLTDTNPLPVSLWVSSLAFSVWHLQNAAYEPPTFVAFQMLYTFFTGLWLGYLRWRTGRLLPCVIAHFALNLASNLW